MIRTKMMSSKEYTNLCIENTNKLAYDEQLNKSKVNLENATIQEFNDDLYSKREAYQNKTFALRNFSESVKVSLLHECINKLYTGSLSVTQKSVDTTVIGNSLINNFINENGVDTLLRNFRTKTLLLSEFSRLVNKYHKLIIEAVDKNNPDSFVIDTTIKDNFFDELDMTNPDNVILNIRTRVADAVQDFIDGNVSDKIDIKDIIQTVQDKVNTTKVADVQECYSIQGKRAIGKLREKTKNVFGAMVTSMVESTLRDETMRAYYQTADKKLDIDKIVENCELMYTLLETVNTAKIIKVDESYIKSVMVSLKA